MILNTWLYWLERNGGSRTKKNSRKSWVSRTLTAFSKGKEVTVMRRKILITSHLMMRYLIMMTILSNVIKKAKIILKLGQE